MSALSLAKVRDVLREASTSLRATHAGRVLEEELLKIVNGQPDKRDLGPQLGALLDSGRFSDVVVRVGQEEIKAHSAILAARSPVFEAMWSSGMREQQQKEVVIKDLDPGSVRRMLRFMYTGALDVKLEKDSDAISLLEVAHQYDVASLVEVCVATLSSWLTEDKAAEYLMIAEHAGLECFRKRCLEFITSSHTRVAEVQATEAFSRLAEKRPHLAVEILAKAIPPVKRQRTAAASLPSTAPSSSAASVPAVPAPTPPAALAVAPPTAWYPAHPPAWRPPPMLGGRPPVPLTAAWALSAPTMPPLAPPLVSPAAGGCPFPMPFGLG